MDKKITVKTIESMKYIDFVSFLNEENRPPGGKQTIREVMINSFINKQSKVLEVGSTNGFSSLEIGRTIGCEVFGIDISKSSVENANKRVRNKNIQFQVASAYNIPFDEGTFDLVLCGNATSFMDNKHKAIQEYIRVTKEWGFIALTPMYYLKKPESELLKKVSQVIGAEINITSKDEWISILKKMGLEIYYCKDFEFGKKSKYEISKYCESFLSKDKIINLDNDVKQAIFKKWMAIMEIFNENLSHIGFSVILLRKRGEKEESEFFNNFKEIKN